LPTIAIASSKGGCGKTTTALVLASTLAHRGVDVGLLESDLAANLMAWKRVFEKFGTPPKNIVVGYLDAERSAAHIAQAQTVTDTLIIDLAGGTSSLYEMIAATADLIIIPLMVSGMDVNGAAMATDALRAAARGTRQKQDLPIVAAISRYDPVTDARDMMGVKAKLAKIPIPVLAVPLAKRRVFKVLTSLPCTLHELDADYRNESWRKAIDNAEAFTNAVLEMMPQ
jgi:chromosome partitioning protein